MFKVGDKVRLTKDANLLFAQFSHLVPFLNGVNTVVKVAVKENSNPKNKYTYTLRDKTGRFEHSWGEMYVDKTKVSTYKQRLPEWW